MNKCAICKKKKGRLSTTTENCKRICDGSDLLSDGILNGFSDDEKTKFMYHTSCLSAYKLKIQRAEKRQPDLNASLDT